MSRFYVTNAKYNDDIIKCKGSYLKDKNEISINKVKYLTIIESSYNSNSINLNEAYCVIDGQIYNESENLIELYNKYGIELINKLNGEFSFIIFDKIKNILFGVRDRLGAKPLFYTKTNNRFECSSSLKSICYGDKFSINENARSMYIKFGFIYDSACIFNEVNKLPAGHYFIYDLSKNKLEIKKYWDLDGSYSKKYPKLNRNETITYIKDLLADSIKIRIPTNKNYGMGISSGTDSFTIYNYFRKFGIDIPLFNVIPTNEIDSEYPLAKKHVNAVNPNKAINAYHLEDSDYLSGVNDYFKFYDEPNSDFSCPITDLLFKKMHSFNNISVAFSGIGSDDIFYGKPIYRRYQGRENEYVLTYSDLECLCKNKITVNDFSDRLVQGNILSMQHYDIKTFLPNLLIKEDIASTFNDVDIRSPFCDYRLVEFTDTIDESIIYYDNNIKYLLKQLIYERFRVNFFGEGKRGFFPDLSRIYKVDVIESEIKDILNKNNLNKYFPEVDYNKVNDKLIRYNELTTDRSILNLYFYIKLILNYESNIFSK